MELTGQFGDQVSLTVGQPLDRVWRVVSDLARIGEWSPECRAVSWRGGAEGPALGAVFEGRNQWGPIRWRTTCTILAWEPLRLVSYDARHRSGAVTRWSFELEDGPAGVTLTQGYQTRGSPRWVIALDQMAGRPRKLRRDMRLTLARMAAAAAHDAEA